MSSELAFTNWQNTAGAVQQTVVNVVQTLKTDTSAISSASGTVWNDTGFQCSITPKSASNKILIIGKFFLGTGYWEIQGKFTKNGSDITGSMGNARGSRQSCSFAALKYDSGYDEQDWFPVSYLYMDTAGTTSPLTYKLWLNSYQTYSLYINRTENDYNGFDYYGQPSSSITLMEIAQ